MASDVSCPLCAAGLEVYRYDTVVDTKGNEELRPRRRCRVCKADEEDLRRGGPHMLRDIHEAKKRLLQSGNPLP